MAHWAASSQMGILNLFSIWVVCILAAMKSSKRSGQFRAHKGTTTLKSGIPTSPIFMIFISCRTHWTTKSSVQQMWKGWSMKKENYRRLLSSWRKIEIILISKSGRRKCNMLKTMKRWESSFYCFYHVQHVQFWKEILNQGSTTSSCDVIFSH